MCPHAIRGALSVEFLGGQSAAEESKLNHFERRTSFSTQLTRLELICNVIEIHWGPTFTLVILPPFAFGFVHFVLGIAFPYLYVLPHRNVLLSRHLAYFMLGLPASANFLFNASRFS
jgi:hypothetical protein